MSGRRQAGEGQAEMEELIRSWDGEQLVMRYDHEADAWMFIAIHSTRLGPAIGGTRMKVYPAPRDGLRDVQRLAAGMTYKWAGIDFPMGGGKGVIALSQPVQGAERERLLERYGELVESLRGGFYTGPDLGVDLESMEIIGRKSTRVRGLTAGDPGPWTALGVFVSVEAVAQELFGSPELKGCTVLVQGVGDAGLPLCKHLHAASLRHVRRTGGCSGCWSGVRRRSFPDCASCDVPRLRMAQARTR
ncbi:MAG: hypothetical protein JSV41_09990 [Gemmatimonadota bacterium]|nr:MAG: hypothetical protein JSV41_09990 [Gemmatimonadota bacterium]